ncbi:MAG: aspartate/glutamate racemase family protein [Minwuiales bacterium]|nr:aspartate/glutamate racemase family protein [Minwuiales bacterium]
MNETSVRSFASMSPEMDNGVGPLGRIGLIVLSSDDVAEDSFKRILPDDLVACFTSRIPFPDAGTPDALLAMAEHLTGAATTILPENRIDLLAYSCTSGAAAIGEQKIAELLQKARPGVACTNPLTAATAAFEKLGARRVAVLTPYPEAIHRQVIERILDRGFDVTETLSFDLHRDSDIGRVTPAAIRQAVRRMNLARADAVFVSCTLLRALETIEPVEAEVGVPLVTSIQAMAWHALGLLRYDRAIEGFGQLLRQRWQLEQ